MKLYVKVLCMFAIIICLMASCMETLVQAQESGYKVASVTVGSGESPITSGIFATMQLKNEGCGFIEVTAQESQAWFMHGCDKKFGPVRTNLYWSIGHLGGAPWIGPYLAATVPIAKIGKQEVSITGLTWPGFFLGREPNGWRTEDDGVENPEALLAGWFELVSLNIGRVSLTASHLNYLDSPNVYLFGVEYTQPLNGRVSVKGSVNWYQAKVKEDRRPMFALSGTWNFQK